MSLEFTYKKFIRSPARFLATPLAWVYGALLHIKRKLSAAPLSVPSCIVSIGNIDFGGTGKTPTLLLLLDLFKDRQVAVLTRGYRSVLEHRGSTCITAKALASVIGDEPALILKKFPSISLYVGKDRELGLKDALDKNIKLIFLDDGAQFLKIPKTFEMILIDPEAPIKPLCPTGYRRDVLSPLKTATLILIPYVRSETAYLRAKRIIGSHTKAPCVGLIAHLETTGLNKKIAVLTAIARPERFIKGLEEKGFEVCFSTILDDHAPLNSVLIESFKAEALSQGALAFVCSEKDFIKLEAKDQRLFFPVALTLKPAFDKANWESFIGKIKDNGLNLI